MKKRKLWFLSLGVLLVAAVSISVIVTHNDWGFTLPFPIQRDDTDNNPDDSTGNIPSDDDVDEEDPILDVGPRLTCFDFINLSLQQDGFTHLGGLQWGRGRGVTFGIPWTNNFIFDIGDLTFAFVIDNNHLRPVDWYLDYMQHAGWIYVHDLVQARNPRSIRSGGELATNVSDLSTFNDTLFSLENNVMFYSMKTWMEYYVEKFARFGCPIEDLSQNTMDAYKTQMSTATQARVVSVFDRTSSDGVIRYFADAFQPGRVQDHPRFIEIRNWEEYDALDLHSGELDDDNWEQFYRFILTHHDHSKRSFVQDLSRIDGTALEHFVKDVLFRFTVDGREVRRTPTIGYYFIYIDNPNGQFRFLHQPNSLDFSGMGNLMNFRTPSEAMLVMVNHHEIKSRYAVGLSGWMYVTLKYMLEELTSGVIEVEQVFAPEFIMHYTRPFSPEWQHWMGLTDLFAERYNLTIDNIKRR